MTYFAFLLMFVLPSLIVLAIAAHRAAATGVIPPANLSSWPGWAVIVMHMLIAVVYTTPWDNYLVAKGVWSYPPDSVLFTIGYVPFEEYCFFVLQTWLAGLWLLCLIRFGMGQWAPFKPRPVLNIVSTAVVGVVWLLSVLALAFGPASLVYLTLILAWALPPIMIQLAYGADVLWHHRLLVCLTIVPLTLYLGIADTIAISSDTWTISATYTTGLQPWPGLPMEEFVFFMLTTVLVTFGSTLCLSAPIQQRMPPVMRRFLLWLLRKPRQNS